MSKSIFIAGVAVVALILSVALIALFRIANKKAPKSVKPDPAATAATMSIFFFHSLGKVFDWPKPYVAWAALVSIAIIFSIDTVAARRDVIPSLLGFWFFYGALFFSWHEGYIRNVVTGALGLAALVCQVTFAYRCRPKPEAE